jgi:hypothetical protein
MVLMYDSFKPPDKTLRLLSLECRVVNLRKTDVLDFFH